MFSFSFPGAGLALVMSAAAPAPLAAQTVQLPAGYAPAQSIGFGGRGQPFTPVDETHPLPVAGRQEAFTLISANAAAAPVPVYGGDYVFNQSCTGYGTVSLRVRGPDGATMAPLLTRTANDPAGGTGLALGSGAVVDATASDTDGCNATLTRVP